MEQEKVKEKRKKKEKRKNRKNLKNITECSTNTKIEHITIRNLYFGFVQIGDMNWKSERIQRTSHEAVLWTRQREGERDAKKERGRGEGSKEWKNCKKWKVRVTVMWTVSKFNLNYHSNHIHTLSLSHPHTHTPTSTFTHPHIHKPRRSTHMKAVHTQKTNVPIDCPIRWSTVDSAKASMSSPERHTAREREGDSHWKWVGICCMWVREWESWDESKIESVRKRYCLNWKERER